MKVFIRAQSTPWNAGVSILVGSPDGKTVVKEIVMERHEEFTERKPSFLMEMDVAQTLMDDLWNCGLRPTEGSGSAGALRATERHLEDMRTLVFEEKGSK